jgi:hypothetical protein
MSTCLEFCESKWGVEFFSKIRRLTVRLFFLKKIIRWRCWRTGTGTGSAKSMPGLFFSNSILPSISQALRRLNIYAENIFGNAQAILKKKKR